ncbi:MAG: hydrolase [Candidatus Thiodiazotropha lotti]|uniref:Alpha/beta hydrolase n=1 Tax=Candidatus Thiodiazotropha endoloripes TaxID=1818881 RepID=A0A1E2UTZ7_9GAMM|nr:hydrolase [Candidatus Thiodiazotropha endoloripes]MCG7900116.1 hydrolase [Candidatus Thiodiazotropha weberae]MCG7990885.1 hydrolase [Candidatus Thiodiazotropha lotti]MCG7901516.1 hydrolase [Candidatus Thiodiazotropha weberae]MCG7999251.1 hydrolase [Candidatus Thiodiazotropha lotti]MCW4182539.1 hydrolase [Candidatus Thiodiazotropha weberae]
MASVTHTPFKPAWWLKSPHLQTIWPTLFRSRVKLDLHLERIDLRDGDFIDLSWHQDSSGPLVMLIHGLEGSIRSHYVTPTLQALHQAGFRTLFMHLRGCSGEPNRLHRSYHSGASEDLKEILERLGTRNQLPDAVVGFSLGGNLLLKYLSETGHKSALGAAVAVSVPFNLGQAATRLEQGLSRIYGRYLLDKLKKSYSEKCQIRGFDKTADLTAIQTIYQFDDKITSLANGFNDADDYYNKCSSGTKLKNINTPTLIIHALDDPFMFPANAPTLDQLGPGVDLELCMNGGHVGFIQGNLPFKAEYWLDKRITQYLKAQLNPENQSDNNNDLQLSSN